MDAWKSGEREWQRKLLDRYWWGKGFIRKDEVEYGFGAAWRFAGLPTINRKIFLKRYQVCNMSACTI